MIRTCTKWVERLFCKYNPLIKLCCLYYRNIVKEEIRLANVRNWDRVLCIGGGPIPCTAIEIAYQTNAHIHVIDIDNNAVKCARNVIRKLGLQDRITVINAKGQDIDIEPYDVVHVALQVSPKEEVLKNLWEKSKEGNRIIVRMPRKTLQRFYSNITDDFIKRNAEAIRRISMGCKAKTMDEILLMEKV